MPTPYGSRGGMAFSAEELRVLRGALAVALNPAQPRENIVPDCLRLAESVDEAVREAGRLRAFLLADLARYRDALPGSAGGYLELLRNALTAGYDPCPEDLAALRGLRHRTSVAVALLKRCQELAEQSVRTRLASRAAAGTACASAVAPPVASAPPASRARLHALPGGRAGAGDKSEPRPAAPKPAPAPAPKPDRPIPTPGEVFPPRRKPAPPSQERAAG